jgi:hypothetical protein
MWGFALFGVAVEALANRRPSHAGLVRFFRLLRAVREPMKTTLLQLLALAVLLGSLAAMPNASAQESTSPQADGCKDFEVLAVGGLVKAGSIRSCIDYDHEVSSNTAVFGVVFDATGPDTGLGLTITYTWAAQSAIGCTVASISQAQVAGAFGSNAWAAVDITMTSNQCRAYFTLTVMALTTAIRVQKFSVNAHVPFQNQDNLNRLCNASAFGTACTTPTINVPGCQATNTCVLTVHQDPLSGGLLLMLCGQDPDPACSPIETTSNVSIGNATQNVNVSNEPGFWELFGPTIFAVLFIAVLARIAVWMIPGGVAFGLMVAIMAFQQPFVILVLMQACAGFLLTGAALWWLRARSDELQIKKKNPRKFFE